MRCPKNRFANLPFSTSCGAADGVHSVTKTETVAWSSCTLPDPQVLALVSVNPWLSGAVAELLFFLLSLLSSSLCIPICSTLGFVCTCPFHPPSHARMWVSLTARSSYFQRCIKGVPKHSQALNMVSSYFFIALKYDNHVKCKFTFFLTIN